MRPVLTYQVASVLLSFFFSPAVFSQNREIKYTYTQASHSVNRVETAELLFGVRGTHIMRADLYKVVHAINRADKLMRNNIAADRKGMDQTGNLVLNKRGQSTMQDLDPHSPKYADANRTSSGNGTNGYTTIAKITVTNVKPGDQIVIGTNNGKGTWAIQNRRIIILTPAMIGTDKAFRTSIPIGADEKTSTVVGVHILFNQDVEIAPNDDVVTAHISVHRRVTISGTDAKPIKKKRAKRRAKFR